MTAKEAYDYFKTTRIDGAKVTNSTVEESCQRLIDSSDTQTKKTVNFAKRYLKELNAEAEKKAERETLLEPYAFPDDAKEASKKLTKISNKFGDRAYKEGQSFKDLAQEANRAFPYGEKSEMASATWSFVSFDSYALRMVTNLPANLKRIKKDFPALHEVASASWDRLKEDAEFITKLTEHINDEKARFKGTTAQQFLLSASKNREASREKQEAFLAYSMKMKDWKPAEIVGDKIYVNGKLYSEDDYVGIMIGRGCRVHMMNIYIGEYEDKETKEKKEAIFIRNHTQWRYSDLVILDTIDDIPKELLSERY